MTKPKEHKYISPDEMPIWSKRALTIQHNEVMFIDEAIVPPSKAWRILNAFRLGNKDYRHLLLKARKEGVYVAWKAWPNLNRAQRDPATYNTSGLRRGPQRPSSKGDNLQ